MPMWMPSVSFATSDLDDRSSTVQVAVFEAKFLDPASSAVYGIFLFFGAYGLGLVRALRPKL